MSDDKKTTPPSSGPGAGTPCTDPTQPCPLQCPSDFQIVAPCRIVGVGKSLTIEAREVGGAAAGNYTWTTSSTKITLANNTTPTVTVTGGAAASTAMDAETITVTRSQSGCPDITKTVDVTVFKFTKIEATIKATPAHTARAGFPATADHNFRTTSGSDSFTTNNPLVVMLDSHDDITLEVDAAPAGLPIQWRVTRNPADHASLGGAGDKPTLSAGGGLSRKKLAPDHKGSFNIRPFVDCKGDGSFDPNHAPLCLNLVVANATITSDNCVAQPANLRVSSPPWGVLIQNGLWTGLAAAGMKMELVANVTGGGADGRLGLNSVFAGLNNCLWNDEIRATYRDGTNTPPTNHVMPNVYASNGNAASGAFSGHPLFQPGDAAPSIFSFPHLDSGRANAGLGGELATMGGSGPATRGNAAIGQNWTIQCLDSPSRGFTRFHPARPAAELRQIHYLQTFRANFVFWTNTSGSRGQTNDPCERRYSVILIVEWQVEADWNVTFNAAGRAVLTATTPHDIKIVSRTQVSPIERAEDRDAEVRPPSGIGTMPAGHKVLVWDGRN